MEKAKEMTPEDLELTSNSPIHTFLEESGLTTLYCSWCFAQAPAGHDSINLEHEEGCLLKDV